MAYNGSGTFNLYTPGNPTVTGTTISSTWANNTLSDIATGLSTAVCKDGQTTLTANIPMANFKLTGLAAGSAAGNSLRYEQLFTTSAVQLLGAMDWVKGADVASSTTTNLTTATGNAVHVTGTTTITAVTLGTGMWRLVIFDGVLTLTHHSTNNNLPGAADITTAAGDRAYYWSDGTTVYCTDYVRAASAPLSIATGTSASTFTFNGSGGTSSSVTMTYQKIGNFVTLHIPSATATSGTNSNVFSSDTALPAAIRPPANTQASILVPIQNNGAIIAAPGQIAVDSAGNVQIFRDPTQQFFTDSTVCGMPSLTTFTYFIG